MELRNADEFQDFWKHLKLVKENLREFFENMYDLHMASLENEKIICNVLSMDALDKFQKDVQDGTAGVNFKQALDLDPFVSLELSNHDYFKAKEFFSTLDRTKSQQM